jgi:ArsR family transcriptional regulator
MKDFTKVMKALSDRNRIKILKLLQQKTMCVCELQGVLGLAQPTVSKHLKILEEAGLVDYYKDGLWVNYFVTNGKNSPYAASLLGNLRHWLNEDPEIVELSRRLPQVNRFDICAKN